MLCEHPHVCIGTLAYIDHLRLHNADVVSHVNTEPQLSRAHVNNDDVLM